MTVLTGTVKHCLHCADRFTKKQMAVQIPEE